MPVINIEKFAQAVEEAKKLAKPRRFKQSVELIIKLRDVDIRKPENRLNTIVELPHGSGKEAKICVIAQGDLALKARELADMVLTREDVLKYSSSRRSIRKLAKTYDFFVAQADLMPLIGRYFGPLLAPRGKMPMPVPPNADLKPIIDRLRRSVRIRIRNQPQVMCRIGTEDMDNKAIAENANAVFEALTQKYKIPYNVEKVYVKLTMGPAVKVDPW